MTFTPVTYPINLRRDSQPRTPGIHLSGILRAIATSTGVLKIDPDEIPLDTLIATTSGDSVGLSSPTLMRIITGYAWEEWVSKHLPGSFHPGEYEYDGILATPDGIQFRESGPPLLHEIKATYKSASREFDTHTMWLWQAAGYLRIISEHYQETCTQCVFHPLFLRGSYGPEFPLYKPVLVEFEWAEIESYWGMITRHKHLATPEGKPTIQ